MQLTVVRLSPPKLHPFKRSQMPLAGFPLHRGVFGAYVIIGVVLCVVKVVNIVVNAEVFVVVEAMLVFVVVVDIGVEVVVLATVVQFLPLFVGEEYPV